MFVTLLLTASAVDWFHAVRLPEVVFAETVELCRGLVCVGAAAKESDSNSSNVNNASINFSLFMLCPLCRMVSFGIRR